jgi:hypothetical protein
MKAICEIRKGKGCKGSHPLICEDHGCPVIGGVNKMSVLELHIASAISYMETDGNTDAALGHLAKASLAAREATQLIHKIGTAKGKKWFNKHL